MKKKIFTILFAILLFTVLSITVFAYNKGDVDGNGKIDASDARLALRYSAQLEVLTDEQIAAADVDGSGKVTASDARKILRVAANLDAPFEKISLEGLLVEEGVLNVAVPVENKPFAYTENGELKGIDISIAEKLAESAELELKLHPMPYDEIFNAVNSGNCDIAMSANKSDTENIKTVSQAKVYCEGNSVFLVRAESELKNGSQILEDSSLKIGVIDNSIEKYIAQTELKDHHISGYTTCGQAVTALKNGEIDVIVLKDTYANAAKMEDWDIESISYNVHSVKHVVITASENTVLAEKISKLMTDKIIDECVSIYDCVKMNSKLTMSRSSIRIAPGGTAVIAATVDSFFYDFPSIYINSDYVNIADIVYADNVRYYVLTVSNNAKSEKAEFYVPNEPAIFKLDVIVDSNAPKNYILDDNSVLPDFGAYTKTTASTVIVQDGIIALAYDAETVAENGITDTSMLQGYYDALAAAGYEYLGYEVIDNAMSYMFYNKSIERGLSYVEVLDSDGYVVEFGVGFNYNF